MPSSHHIFPCLLTSLIGMHMGVLYSEVRGKRKMCSSLYQPIIKCQRILLTEGDELDVMFMHTQ